MLEQKNQRDRSRNGLGFGRKKMLAMWQRN